MIPISELDYMDANKYQQQALETMNGDLTKDQYVLNAALGLAGESGEVADIVKKWAFQGHDLDVVKIHNELGDVMWYAALMAHIIGVSLGSVMAANIIKLNSRYPEGFSAARSISRDKDGT